MTLITYAQNFEDVMLWRALKNVDAGFYIDIGAQHPVTDSVSLAFYEKGWRGVHVEPTRQYADLLRKARPDEPVEQVAIGDGAGTITFYEFADTGLSTADAEIARQHQDAGWQSTQTDVAVVTLDDLLARYGTRDIHWLKIDVEGLEASVLASWRTSPVRPWVLVIEATRPMTQEARFADWEPLVIEKGYQFAHYDGLNRFYVHRDHSELLPLLELPPNIFDGFQFSATQMHLFSGQVMHRAEAAEQAAAAEHARADAAVAAQAHAQSVVYEAVAALARADARAGEAEAARVHAQAMADNSIAMEKASAERAVKAESAVHDAEDRAARAVAEAHAAQAHAMDMERRAKHAEAYVDALHGSSSWRYTAPARWTKFQADLLKQHGPTGRSKALVRKIANPLLKQGVVFVTERPKLRTQMVSVAKALGVHEKLRGAYRHFSAVPFETVRAAAPAEVVRPQLRELSPRTRDIYQQLSSALAGKQSVMH